MNGSLFFGVSLTASFLGGMVALFAPCCITFLLPSYLGTIFKNRTRVIFYTLVFAAGLASVLVPVALGMRFIVTLFDRFHTTTYLLGSLMMFLVGLMTLFEAKLMFPLPRYTMPEKTTFTSTYLLGLFSGITSSCCAPVLFAAVTLSSLSPTLITSLVVSLVYVLGIVFPLFFLSLFYEKLTDQYLYKIKKGVDKPLKIAASLTFMISSVVIAVLALTGRIEMDYGTVLRNFIYGASSIIPGPLLDLLVLLAIITLFIYFIKETRHEKVKK